MDGEPPMWPRRVAVGVFREDPPVVFLAESEPALGRLVTTEFIAHEPVEVFRKAGLLEKIQAAVREHRWADCISIWMEATGVAFDGYPDEEIFRIEDLEDRTPLENLAELPILRSTA